MVKTKPEPIVEPTPKEESTSTVAPTSLDEPTADAAEPEESTIREAEAPPEPTGDCLINVGERKIYCDEPNVPVELKLLLTNLPKDGVITVKKLV